MITSHSKNNSQNSQRSFSNGKSGQPNMGNSDETMFRTLLSDPNKRAWMLKLLEKEPAFVTPLRTNSQTSINVGELRNTDREVNGSVLSSPVRVDGVLKGVVAYVDLRSKEGLDRSNGAKALMQSLDATVRDSFTNDVTHVIFKDGSFDTYLKAKQSKVHVVSVLWLEAVRNRNVRVPEEDYPALGTSEYDANITEMCKDYEELVRDELHAATSQRSNHNRKKTALPIELGSLNSSHGFTTPDCLSDRLIPTSPNCEVDSIVSYDSGMLPSRHGLEGLGSDRLSNSTPELTSDNDSDCGVINGRSAKRTKNQKQIDLSNYSCMDASQRSITESTPSFSLLSTNTKRVTMDDITDMDLTDLEDKENAPDPQLQTQKSKKLSKPVIKSGKKIIAFESITLKKGVKDNKLKACSDSALTTKQSVVNLRHGAFTTKRPNANLGRSESTPSLRISNSSKNSSQRLTRSGSRASLRLSQDCLNLNHSNEIIHKKKEYRGIQNSLNDDSLTPKKRARLKSKVKEVKKQKVALEADAVTSLKVSTNSTLGTSTTNSSMPSLRISADTAQREMENLENHKNMLQRHSINTSESLTPKAPTSFKSKAKEVKKQKVSETNSSMPSLRISADSVQREINNQENHNLLNRNSINVSLIDRLSRMAIRGSADTIDKSNEDRQITQNVSLLTNTSKGSFQSCSSSTSPNKRLLQNISNVISSLSSDEEEGENGITLEKPKSQNTNQIPNRNLRKLYNPNQTIDEAHQMWVEEENRKAYNVPNKQLVVTLVPLAPIYLTPNAKKFLKVLGGRKTTNSEKKSHKLDKRTQKTKEEVNKKKEKNKASKKNTKINKGALEDENDEQIELTDEILNRGKRKSLRLVNQSNKSTTNRRSTLDFVNTPRLRKHNLFVQNRRKIKPSIVCTRLHKPDVVLFIQIVRNLGTFFVEDEVSKKTTHLVVGEAKRTINLLRALARGCWILKQEWLLRSLEAHKWLPEEDFELTEFSPAVQKCRLYRQAFGRAYSMDIFENCGAIYIARSSNPRRTDLEELVQLCKGSLSNTAINADIVVGEWVRYDAVCVSEQWILDSIMWNKKKSFRKYLIE